MSTISFVRSAIHAPLSGDASTIIQDKSEIERMKADILRRVEEISDEDEESDGEGYDEDSPVKVKLGGDGEDSDEETGERPGARDVETILELAYIADPRQFDRDAQTRRSQARVKLRAQTGENCAVVVISPLIVLFAGWVDEQIEGWKIMLERNVSSEANWPADFVLRLPNLNSQRKTKSSRNTNFLGINRARSNPHEGREDPDRVTRRERGPVVAAEGGAGAAEGAEVVDPVEEAEAGAGMPVTELSRTRTKLRGAITTGNGVTTRRWRRQGRHLRSIEYIRPPESYKDRDIIFVGESNGCDEVQIGDASRKTYP